MRPAAPGTDVHPTSINRDPAVANPAMTDGRALKAARTPARLCTPRRVPVPAISRLAGLVGLLAAFALVTGAPAGAAVTHPYTGVSFGPGGVGSGTFGDVQGVTFDQSSGDVLVYDDAAGGRIYKFDAAGVPVDFSSTGTNVIEGVGTTPFGERESELAVDESSGPDAGDIYLANSTHVGIYSETGASLGELTGAETCGVAVDPSGYVYVGEYGGGVHRYAPVANPVENADENGSIAGLSGICNVAVDSAGDVYVARYGGGVNKYDAMQFGSLSASGTLVDENGYSLAVDQASGEVFVDEQARLSQYDGSEEPPALHGTSGASGAGALGQSFGVGVDHESGELYAGDHEVVEIFGAGEEVPGASTGAATDVSGTSATLHGSVEPGGHEVTSCVFEYGSKAGALTQQQACTPSTPYSGSAKVEVSATITGLNTGTPYHYRVTIATASETLSGGETSFKTTGPIVSGESFHGVGESEATLTAEVDPNGEATTYRVEYGPSSAYGSSTSPAVAGAGEIPVAVQSAIRELQPGTTYHFRFVAESAGGNAYGPDVKLLTPSPKATGLPDDRGYEMVTPTENEGTEPYVPTGSDIEGTDALYSRLPTLAAADGDALVYPGAPTAGGNGSQGDGHGNQFLAHRNASGGWTQEDIQPPGHGSPVYWAFSKQLETGVLLSREAIVPGGTAGYPDLYVRNDEDGSYEPLSTVTPPNRIFEGPDLEFGAADQNGLVGESSLGERYAGASADNSHQLFEANDVLASGAVNPGVGANNLYDSVEGQLHTVNVLPDGSPAPNASFGGPTGADYIAGEQTQNAFSHAISADGSRIFWTDMNNGSLYVREDDARTSLIAEDATYLTASSDGSKVLYTKAGDLYEDDLESGVTRDLAPGAQVLGLMGASEDLEYVYFVGQGALTSGASAGGSNMYVLHEGQIGFVATLGAEQEEEPGLHVGNSVKPWAIDIGYRTADVTPSGRDIAFMSTKSLTGYDNFDRGRGQAEFEVYLYDASSAQISCVSCIPSGEPPVNPRTFGGTGAPMANMLAISLHSTYQLHVISEDGDRVFFDSIEPLVPEAQGDRMNVYEWERDGSGSCTDENGCIYILSTGSSSSPSYLLDASASGNDVFLMTRSQLVPADKNEYFDVYDARVGATEPPTPSQCTGTGCQGVAASPPVFATPASTTYNGVGNFAPPVTPAAKPKPKPKKKTPSCKKQSKKKQSKKNSKAKRSAKQAKAKPALCKAKKAAKRVRRHTNGRGGR
jgi:hypothetical protein